MQSKQQGRWLLPVSFIVLFLVGVFAGTRLISPVTAKTDDPVVKADQVKVIPLQGSRDNYALAMIDTKLQTIWFYEVNSRAATHNRLRLLAARSWKFDRLLDQYNTAEPTPPQVELLLERMAGQQEMNDEQIAEEQRKYLQQQEMQLQQQKTQQHWQEEEKRRKQEEKFFREVDVNDM